jgi:hypothetical protein
MEHASAQNAPGILEKASGGAKASETETHWPKESHAHGGDTYDIRTAATPAQQRHSHAAAAGPAVIITAEETRERTRE